MLPTTNLTEYELEELLALRRKNREAMRKSRAAKKAAAPPLEAAPEYILTDTEAAYIAGFFDGEGMVTISMQRTKGSRGMRVNPAYTMSIRVSQSSLPVIRWMVDKCGGSITEKRIKGPGRRHWILAKKSNSARIFLEKILPYLIVKREQAEYAIAFQERLSADKNRYEVGRSGPVPKTAEQMAYKEEYLRILQSLKHM